MSPGMSTCEQALMRYVLADHNSIDYHRYRSSRSLIAIINNGDARAMIYVGISFFPMYNVVSHNHFWEKSNISLISSVETSVNSHKLT